MGAATAAAVAVAVAAVAAAAAAVALAVMVESKLLDCRGDKSNPCLECMSNRFDDGLWREKLNGQMIIIMIRMKGRQQYSRQYQSWDVEQI
jgi:acetyl-CoA acetyltransferase